MNKITKITLSLCTIGALSSLSALEFQSIGYKSTSMGGTGVANPSANVAVYMNPAMLAFSKSKVDVGIGVGISAQDNGLLPSIDALDKTNFSALMDKASLDITTLTATDISNLQNATTIISNMNGNGVSVTPEINVGIQLGNFGFGVYGYGEVAGRTIVDQTRTALIIDNGGTYYDINGNTVTQAVYDSTSLEYAINNGLTKFDFNGLLIGEIPVGYGQMFESKYGQIAVGGSLKYMNAKSSFNSISMTNYDTLKDEFDKNTMSSSTYGIDLGLAYKPKIIENLTIGLVAKNINTPSFKTINGDYNIDPMIRTGLSYDLGNILEVAVDYDISKNKSLNNDFDTQYLGLGLNYHQFSFVSASAGIKSNMANNNTGLIYTAGIGFGPQFLHVELAGEMSSKSNSVSGTDIPAYSKATISLVSTF
jgi:hypothetical protein